ncbi:hypothetical protein V1477_006198, partial [Vespula maculifrons]
PTGLCYGCTKTRSIFMAHCAMCLLSILLEDRTQNTFGLHDREDAATTSTTTTTTTTTTTITTTVVVEGFPVCDITDTRRRGGRGTPVAILDRTFDVNDENTSASRNRRDSCNTCCCGPI